MSLKAELETWAAALKAYDEEDFDLSLELFSVRPFAPPLPCLVSHLVLLDHCRLFKNPHEHGPYLRHDR